MYCNYRLNCKYFGKCGFIHTPLEKEFFEFKQSKLSTKDIDLDLLPPPLEDIDLDLLPPPPLELEFDINSFIMPPPLEFTDIDDTKILETIKQQSLEVYAEKCNSPKKIKKFIVKKRLKKIYNN